MTKTDSKSFLSNAAVYGVGGVLLEAASVVLLPLYLKCLKPEEYGTLEILNRIGTFVTIGLMANGFRMAALTFYQQATSDSDRRQIAATVSVALFVVVLVGVLISFATASWLARGLGLASADVLRFGMITVLLESSIIIPLALIQARIESVRFVSVTFAMFFARVALAIYLVSILGLGLWGILISRALVAVVFGAVLNSLELWNSWSRINWTWFRSIFSFSLPFLPGGFLAFFINYGDRFYLLKEVGEREVGLYSLSNRLATATSMFAFSPLGKVWCAQMYGAAKQSNAPKIFGSMFSRLIASLVFVGLVTSVFCEDLLRMIGGKDYIDAIKYLPPLLLAVLFSSASDLMDSGLYVTRKTKYKPWIFLVTGIVIYAFYYVLIPRFGSFGAAWATLIAYLVQVTLTWLVTQKVFYVKYEWVRLLTIVGGAVGIWILSRLFLTSQHRIAIDIVLILSWCVLVGLCATGEERRIVASSVRKTLIKLKWISKTEQPDNLLQ